MTLTVRDVYVHENHHCNEVRELSLEKLAADPSAPVCPGRVWHNTTTEQVRYADSAGVVQTLARISDVERRPRCVGTFSAASGTVPSVATIPDPADGSTDLDAGDWWIVTTGGVLAPAPLYGNATVEPGDLVYAASSAPLTNADFYAIQTNIISFPGGMYFDEANLAVGGWTGPVAGAWTFLQAFSALVKIEDAHTYKNAKEECFFGVEVTGNTVTLTSLVDPATFGAINLRVAGTHV